MVFSELIRQQWLALNLTQSALAEQLFVSNKTISNWKTGKTLPDFDNLLRIAKVLSVSLDQLLLEDDQMVKSIKVNERLKMMKRFMGFASITNALFLVLSVGHSILGDWAVYLLVAATFLIFWWLSG